MSCAKWVCIAFFISTVAIGSEPSASQVIDRYLTAIGGTQQIDKLKDMQMVATLDVNGQKLNLKDLRKHPTKNASEISANGAIMFRHMFDGKKGVMVQGSNQIPFSEYRLARAKESYLIPERHLQTMGIEISLEGIEIWQGKDSYKIALKRADGFVSHNFYDVETGLKIGQTSISETPMGEVEQMIVLGDYRMVDGIKLPYRIMIVSGPQTSKVKVDQYQLNSNLDDALFMAP